MAKITQKTEFTIKLNLDELNLIIWSLENNKHRLTKGNPPSAEQTEQIKDISRLLNEIS